MVAPRMRVGLGVTSLGLWCLAFANWVEPVVRLSADVLNPLVGLVLMLLLPCPSLVWLAQWQPTGVRQTTLQAIGMAACALPALVGATLALGAAFATYDIVFEGGEAMKPIGRYAVGDSSVVLYRRNGGGATTSYAIHARQEEAIAPGVLRVAELVTVEAEDAEVELLGRDRVRLTFEDGARVLKLPFS